jgi:hypothetical protein
MSFSQKISPLSKKDSSVFLLHLTGDKNNKLTFFYTENITSSKTRISDEISDLITAIQQLLVDEISVAYIRKLDSKAVKLERVEKHFFEFSINSIKIRCNEDKLKVLLKFITNENTLLQKSIHIPKKSSKKRS